LKATGKPEFDPLIESMNSDFSQNPVLLGSTFPLSLIRRKVVIEPIELDLLRGELRTRGFESFWGHRNTLPAAREILGLEVVPASARPALSLNEDRLLLLNGRVFRECLVLSPEYKSGYRPGVGEEVAREKISGWTALRLKWI